MFCQNLRPSETANALSFIIVAYKITVISLDIFTKLSENNLQSRQGIVTSTKRKIIIELTLFHLFDFFFHLHMCRSLKRQ